MRGGVLTLGLSLAMATPVSAMETSTFHMVRVEIDTARVDDEDVFNWDGDAWIGQVLALPGVVPEPGAAPHQLE